MSHQELNEALEVVHQELSEAEHLDASEVEKLRATMLEIQATLRDQTEAESLSDRITASARELEESHPVLTRTLGRIADMLQQMGI